MLACLCDSSIFIVMGNTVLILSVLGLSSFPSWIAIRVNSLGYLKILTCPGLHCRSVNFASDFKKTESFGGRIA